MNLESQIKQALEIENSKTDDKIIDVDLCRIAKSLGVSYDRLTQVMDWYQDRTELGFYIFPSAVLQAKLDGKLVPQYDVIFPGFAQDKEWMTQQELATAIANCGLS